MIRFYSVITAAVLLLLPFTVISQPAKTSAADDMVAKKKKYGTYYYEPSESEVNKGRSDGFTWTEVQGKDYLKNGNLPGAAMYFHILQKMDTNSIWPYANLANLYYQDHDYKTAIYYYDIALLKNKDDFRINGFQHKKAICYLALKKYAECKAILQPLTEGSSPSYYAMITYARLLREQKKPEAVYMEWFKKACASDDDGPRSIIKDEEPRVYAALFSGDDNWKAQTSIDKRLASTPKTEPVKPSSSGSSSIVSSSTKQTNTNNNKSTYVAVACPECNGGRKTITTSCNICSGSGIIRYETRTEKKQEGAYMKTYQYKVPVNCGKCYGTGKLAVTCGKCYGKGTIMVKQ